MINIKEVTYSPWGRCLRLCDGINEAFVTLDFGPRVIRFSPIGRENMFFEDIEDNVNGLAFEKESIEMFGKDKGIWHIRGGHRMWTSPEQFPETYYPDNAPVSYEIIENGVILTPPEQAERGLSFSFEMTMPEENCFHIVHKIKNTGSAPITLAPWALTVLAPGGCELIPVATHEETLLDNRHFVLWRHTKMMDPRVSWGDKYIRLSHDATVPEKFKFGTLSQHGWAAYFNRGNVFVKYFDTNEDMPHPDRNCNFETFTAKDMLECESIGILSKLFPGDEVCHSECWCMYTDVAFPETDEDADIFVKNYVE